MQELTSVLARSLTTLMLHSPHLCLHSPHGSPLLPCIYSLLFRASCSFAPVPPVLVGPALVLHPVFPLMSFPFVPALFHARTSFPLGCCANTLACLSLSVGAFFLFSSSHCSLTTYALPSHTFCIYFPRLPLLSHTIIFFSFSSIY